MLGNPFADPFGLGGGLSMPDVFRRRGGGGRGPRKAEAAQEPEAEPMVSEAPPGEAPESDKVVLKNPRWEVEKVGFNEETDISVEAVLPESQAHKTRVEFELFAKTPEGVESISKGQGHIEGGKAKARIPVYIPQYRDEEGNLLPKVEFFFSAKHSQSDLCKDEEAVKVVEEMAERLIESHILQDVTFATGKSFPSPFQAGVLKSLVAQIKEWKVSHPEGKLAVFGHADAVGKEDANKKLSERRAAAVHAFLMKEAMVWETLFAEEKWGLDSIQQILKFLGHDPGAMDGKDGPKTQGAVKAFQASQRIPETGQADAPTRKAIFKVYMDTCNSETLMAKDFDAIDGKPHAGCSEYNRVEYREGECQANRRVAVLLLKSTKNFPIQYPCKQGDIGPCKKQVSRKGQRRTAGFGCLFYDKLVKEAAGGGPANEMGPGARALFSPHANHAFGYDIHEEVDAENQHGEASRYKGEPELDFLSIESGKIGLVELHMDKVAGKDIHFTLAKPDVATVNPKDSSANPVLVVVTASKTDQVIETRLQARFGAENGPILCELGLVLLPPLQFKARYIRIEDPKSPGTKLTTALSIADLQSEMNVLYRSGAAQWMIEGEDGVTGIGYDIIKNGALDLEPGVESKELREIKKKLPAKGVNIIHVHDLRWSYFLAKPAKPGDTILTLKEYGGYLDYIGRNIYSIEDGAGNSVDVEVASVDKVKREVTLTAPIGIELKLADSPALIWPLGGLSGNPTIISDIGTKDDLIIYAAHELGHTLAGFYDLVEKENVMFGGPSTGRGLRHRPIPKFYYPHESEEQWKSMREKR